MSSSRNDPEKVAELTAPEGLPSPAQINRMDAGELADLFDQLFGRLWFGYDRGRALSEHQLLAQFKRDRAGRLVLTAIFIRGEAVTSDDLRRVAVASLENTANLSNAEARTNLEGLRDQLPPLKRQPGMLPEDFSRLVAQHYLTWARLVPHPASAIAREQRVNLATVHTWIREARLRGFLPPGARRKVAPGNASQPSGT